jgi:hypothetical protein
LNSYAANGSGTVQGSQDPEKETQIAFWQRAAKEGFTDQARAPRLNDFAPHSMRSTSDSPSIRICWAKR